MHIRDLADEPLVYLASPYSKYPGGMDVAYRNVLTIAAKVMKEGVRVFCPIAHSHSIAVRGEIDLRDHEFWLRQDFAVLDGCSVFVVADMDGWRESHGVREEWKRFTSNGRIGKSDCFLLKPDTLEIVPLAREAFDD